MVLAAPFSPVFWVCYLGGGVSDLLDGPVARALHIQSDVGAAMDSAAGLVFAAAIAVVVFEMFSFPHGSGYVPGALRWCGLQGMAWAL
jgi:CDP-diacylglycerol--glycerol-3-phosphate 3-phosphatidyltransferase